MRTAGALLLLIATALGWFSFGDRRTAAALTVVELDGRLGVPVAAPVAALGLLLVLVPRRKKKETPLTVNVTKRARSPSPAPPREAGGPREAAPTLDSPSLESEGWLAALRGQAGRLPLEAGASVQVDPGRTPPVQLILDRLTPERARRSVELFAELLATMPTPPRAAVRYEGCVTGATPRHVQVIAAMRRYFPAERFVATTHEDVVELVFRAPDTRWTE